MTSPEFNQEVSPPAAGVRPLVGISMGDPCKLDHAYIANIDFGCN